tara:strand:- start:8 stop:1210 length:1203 start_codon:yes stop_codon:yes gene_type:complete
MDVMIEKKLVPKLRFKQYNDNWNTLTLEKLSIINMGQSPESKSYNQLGEGMLLVQGNADIKNRLTNPRQWTSEPTKKCQIGDLILTVRAPVGAIAKSVHNACIGRGVCSISNNSKSDIEYLYQTLVNYEKKWIRLEQGSTFTAVSGKDIRGIKLNIPSLPEQQKIASFLSAVDEKLQQLTKKKDLLEEYKKGVMQKVFSQELRFKDDNGNNYPDWEEKKLGEVLKYYDGTHQTPKYVEKGVPFYSVEHLTANQFTKTKFISEAVFEKENRRVKLEKGDILMTRIGDIGTSRLIDWDVNASFYVSLALLKQNLSFDSAYLQQYISSVNFQKELWSRTIHVAFPKKINLGEIGKCKALFPDLEQQQKIANFLTSLDSKIESVSTQIENTKAFKKGLLQQMFV